MAQVETVSLKEAPSGSSRCITTRSPDKGYASENGSGSCAMLAVRAIRRFSAASLVPREFQEETQASKFVMAAWMQEVDSKRKTQSVLSLRTGPSCGGSS